MSGRRDDEFTEYVTERMWWLRRLAYLLCQDWPRADDLVQATITRLYTHWGRAASVEHTDGYVRTILVREYLSERRSGWARRVSLTAEPPDSASVLGDREGALDLRAALAGLPPRQRATLVLRFYFTRALLRRIAANVRFGGTARIVFPFQLPALPAGWALSGAGYTQAGGRLLGTGNLTAGPADDPGALNVQVEPASRGGHCRIIPGQWSRTRVQGALAAMRTLNEPGNHVQQVCARDVAGLYLWLSLDRDVPRTSRPVPGGAGLGSALSLAGRLRLLGAGPAAWTTDPVR